MARAQQEEDALKERGSFVVVNAGAASTSIFNAAIDTTQSFVIAVKDKGLSLRQVLNDFSQYNRTENRIWNLALQIKNIPDYQLIVVKGIPSLAESMSYFRKVVVSRSLFDGLGQTTYRIFLITDDNLQKLLESNNVDGYMDFFRNRYIQQNQDQTPETVPPGSDIQNDNTRQNAAPTQTTVPQNITEPVEESSVYKSDVEGEQMFVFVIPIEGVNVEQFVNGIKQYNLRNYETLNLEMEQRTLDNFRLVIAVKGIPDKQTGLQYSGNLVQDRQLFSPLGTTTYRNFIITPENLEIFMGEKNIVDYTNFYKRVYLNQ